MQAICPQKLYIVILRRLTSPLPPAMSLSPVSFPIPRPIHHHDPVTETNGATRPIRLSPDQSSKSDSLPAPIPAPAAGRDRPTEKQPKSHHHLPRADMTHPTSPRTRTSATTTTTATGQKLPPPETDRDFYTERHC